MSCSLPIIRDTEGDFSSTCPRRVGLKDLTRIHRTLPVFQTDNEDIEVLQAEDGAAILDEITANHIIDNLKE
jgi:1,6-anhydro-N-acetylmuramate kinase